MKILVSILILLFSVSASLACMCINADGLSDAEHSKYLKKVKTIFYGEIVSLGEKHIVERKYRGGVTFEDTFQPVKFKVLRAWKGVEDAEVFLEADTESSCGFSPQLGSKIMVYAYESRDLQIPLYINQCSINENQFDEERMKREYGAGKVFEQTQIEQTQIKQPLPQTENVESFWSGIWRKITSLFS